MSMLQCFDCVGGETIVLVVKRVLAGAWHDRHSGSRSCCSTTMLVALQNLLHSTKPCKSCKYYQSAIHPCTHCTLVSSQNDHVAQPESPDICSSVALVIQATDEVPSRRLVLTRSPILYVSNILRTSAVLCWAYMAQKGSIAPPAASMIRAPPPGC